MTKQVACDKCKGSGQYMYDENHITVCEACCTHPDGWWKMEKHYGTDNGKYTCKKGCRTILDELPSDEESLMQLTKDALADVLGREPTKQEILRAHAGFKRMAVVMYEHLKHEKEDEK